MAEYPAQPAARSAAPPATSTPSTQSTPELGFNAPPALRLPFSASTIEREPILTERMRLRPLLIEDAEDVWQYARLAEVIRYIPWPERTREEARDHTGRRSGLRVLAKNEDAIILACQLVGEPSLGNPAPGGVGVGGVEFNGKGAGDKGAGGDRVIGDVMLRVDDRENAGVEIGWVFHPDFQGRGLASEAASAVMNLAFETVGAHRVHAQLDLRNDASAALCRRLGMRLEAVMLEEEYFKGEWTDTAVYAVLRREWAALRPEREVR